MAEENMYQTTDLFLASFLKGLDFEILDVTKNGPKITFHFKDREDRKQLVIDYFNARSSIEPLKFVRAQRDLKGLIYNI